MLKYMEIKLICLIIMTQDNTEIKNMIKTVGTFKLININKNIITNY